MLETKIADTSSLQAQPRPNKPTDARFNSSARVLATTVFIVWYVCVRGPVPSRIARGALLIYETRKGNSKLYLQTFSNPFMSGVCCLYGQSTAELLRYCTGQL